MFRPGQQIGIYTLINRLGRGGFGEVWLAERRAKFVTTKVAVKLPHDETVDQEAIKQEAGLWEKASGHPNVLPIIEADEYDGQIIIVSEYAPDGSLEDLLKGKGSLTDTLKATGELSVVSAMENIHGETIQTCRLSVKKAAEMSIGILKGLEFLHSRNIIHRDLKPANILLQGDTPRLADFGISRLVEATSLSIKIAGTPVYMAPEAFDKKRSVQTDIWSVGVMLYQMLAGNLPFRADSITDLWYAVTREEPEPLPADVPPALQQIITKTLAKKPEERYRNAQEIRKDLSKFLLSISQEDIKTTQPTITPDSTTTLNQTASGGSMVTMLTLPQQTVEQNTQITPPRVIISEELNTIVSRPKKILKSLGLAASALILLFLCGLIGLSWFNNNRLTNDAGESARRVSQIVQSDQGRDPSTKNAAETQTEMDAVDNLRLIGVKLDQYERDGTPIYLRGWYTGNRLFHEEILPVYFQAVERRFKQPTIKNLEADLQNFASNQTPLDPSSLTEQQEQEQEFGAGYDLLKAYLMLSPEYKNQAEPIFLTAQLEDYWKKSSPPELENLSQQQLTFYATQVDREEFPRIALNKNLVDAVRKRLTAYPLVLRFYKRVTTSIASELEPIRVKTVLSQNGGEQSIVEGNYKVPGSFTLEGFRRVQKAFENSQTELAKDDWVLGEKTSGGQIIVENVGSKLRELYLNDYADQWHKFVRSVSVASYGNKKQAVDALDSLSSANSPMDILLREIARNTNFSAKQKPAGWAHWLISYFKSTDEALSDGNTIVEREFQPLILYVGDDSAKNNSQIIKYRVAMQRLSNELEVRTEFELQQTARDLATGEDAIKLRQTEAQIDNITRGFASSASGQDVAALLKMPTQNLRAYLAGLNAQTNSRKN